jgi:choline-phosphate cytidylyltransferase
MDSPTYDGDVESTSTATAAALNHSRHVHQHHRSLLSTSTLNSPSQSLTPSATIMPTSPGPGPGPGPGPAANGTTNHNHDLSRPIIPIIVPDEPAPVPAAANSFNPASLSDTDIQTYVQNAIDGEPHRPYKINKPPTDRPVRIYADGSLHFLSIFPTSSDLSSRCLRSLPLRVRTSTIPSIPPQF